MQIYCNESPRELPGPISIQELLAQLGITPRGVAVAVNSAVVVRSAWAEHLLQDGDRVLVIQAAQGG